MPVPLPEPSLENQRPPDAVEVLALSRGVIGVVAPDGGLTSLQRLLIEAVVSAMTGIPPDLSADPISPEAFAEALALRSLGFRTRIVQMVILYVLVLQPVPLDVVDRVERFAREAGVEEGMLSVAHEFATGSLGLAALDFERNGYASTWKAEDEQLLHLSTHVGGAWDAVVDDPELARRWQDLEELPAGTLGRRVADFYRARGFTYPGHPGSAPPFLAQHDWVHVTADYGTTVESELEVFAFIARANDDMRAFSLLAMVVSLFETAYLPTGAGLFEADAGHLVPGRRGHPPGRCHAPGGPVHRQHRLPPHRLVLARPPARRRGAAALRGRPQGPRRRRARIGGPLGARWHQPLPVGGGPDPGRRNGTPLRRLRGQLSAGLPQRGGLQGTVSQALRRSESPSVSSPEGGSGSRRRR